MKSLSISSPGKIHLLGEHSVVYGKPAVIASVNKRCYVRLTERSDSVICLTNKGSLKTLELPASKVISFFETAQKQLKRYRNGDGLLSEIIKDHFSYPLIIIGQALHAYSQTIIPGFSLEIQSEIPTGRGMGSSAALAVSISAALTVFLGKPWDLAVINAMSYLAEEKMHGTPSGGDNAACTYGGFLLYQKKEIQPLTDIYAQTMLDDFFLVDTGRPTETTGEMVQYVRDKVNKDAQAKQQIEKIFQSQEELVYILLEALKEQDYPVISKALTNSEKNLEKLGVVSTSTKKLIRAFETSDLSAKVCGAGGRIDRSGILLCFGRDHDRMKQIALDYSSEYLPVSLGAEGVKLE